MVSPAIAFKFSDETQSNFETLISLYQQISTFLCSCCHVSVDTFLALTAPPAWILLLLYSKKKNKIGSVEPPQGLILAAMAEHAFATTDDAEYAEQIQLQESLLASVFTSTIPNPTSTSLHQPIVFCEICLESKHSWEMFTNDNCSHSFCYACTTGHIMAKIQDKAKTITCPSLNCKSTINTNDCRQMIPNNALVKWDELLCLSLIPESHKLYCPFRDCSSMLVNDSGGVLRNIKCLSCKRSFCAECRVPWHSEFTCKEFQKVCAKKGDKIVKWLAKKKKWQKCSKCKMYVEKVDGCTHITCRCEYEFCYRCGSEWSDSHGICKQKLWARSKFNWLLGR